MIHRIFYDRQMKYGIGMFVHYNVQHTCADSVVYIGYIKNYLTDSTLVGLFI